MKWKKKGWNCTSVTLKLKLQTSWKHFLYLAICKTEKRIDTKPLIVDQNGKSEVKKVTMKPTYLSSYLSILVFTLLLMVYLTFYGINIRDFDYLQRSKSKQDSKFKLHNISKTIHFWRFVGKARLGLEVQPQFLRPI